MSTVKTFLLPDLGEGLADAELLAWSVDIGDTDKVSADVWKTCFGKGFAHVAILGNGALGSVVTQAIAKLAELRNGEAGVIDDDHIRRLVDA